MSPYSHYQVTECDVPSCCPACFHPTASPLLVAAESAGCFHWLLPPLIPVCVPCMLCCSILPFSDAPMPLWRPSTLIQDALLAISLKPKFNKVNSNKSPVDTWIWMSNNSTFGGIFFSQRKRMTNELTHQENIAPFMWTMIRQKLIKISGLMSRVNICKL